MLRWVIGSSRVAKHSSLIFVRFEANKQNAASSLKINSPSVATVFLHQRQICLRVKDQRLAGVSKHPTRVRPHSRCVFGEALPASQRPPLDRWLNERPLWSTWVKALVKRCRRRSRAILIPQWGNLVQSISQLAFELVYTEIESAQTTLCLFFYLFAGSLPVLPVCAWDLSGFKQTIIAKPGPHKSSSNWFDLIWLGSHLCGKRLQNFGSSSFHQRVTRRVRTISFYHLLFSSLSFLSLNSLISVSPSCSPSFSSQPACCIVRTHVVLQALRGCLFIEI